MARRTKKEMKISKAVKILGKQGVGMGFPANVIRRTINQLLKIYGNEGWRFIEDNSFQLVSETILAEQDKQKEIPIPEDNIVNDDDTDTDDDWGTPAPQNFIKDNEPNSSVPILARVPLSDDGSRDIAGAIPIAGESSNAGEVARAEIVPPLRPSREPCYGWIEEVIYKEDDMTTQKSEEKELAAPRVRKRKSGWDLDPSGWKKACSD